MRGPSPSTPVTVPTPRVACLMRSPTLSESTGLSSAGLAAEATPMRVTLRTPDGWAAVPRRPDPKAPVSVSPHGSRPSDPRERPWAPEPYDPDP